MNSFKYIIFKSQLFLSTSLLATCIYKNSYGSDNSDGSDSETSPIRVRTNSSSSNSSDSGASSSGSQDMNLDREWRTRTYIPHFLQNLEAFLIAPDIIQNTTINLARGVEATPTTNPFLSLPEELLNLMFYEALKDAAKELYITPQVSFPGDNIPAISSSSNSHGPSMQQDYKKFAHTSKAVKFNVKMLLLHNIMSEFLGVELNRHELNTLNSFFPTYAAQFQGTPTEENVMETAHLISQSVENELRKILADYLESKGSTILSAQQGKILAKFNVLFSSILQRVLKVKVDTYGGFITLPNTHNSLGEIWHHPLPLRHSIKDLLTFLHLARWDEKNEELHPNSANEKAYNFWNMLISEESFVISNRQIQYSDLFQAKNIEKIRLIKTCLSFHGNDFEKLPAVFKEILDAGTKKLTKEFGNIDDDDLLDEFLRGENIGSGAHPTLTLLDMLYQIDYRQVNVHMLRIHNLIAPFFNDLNNLDQEANKIILASTCYPFLRGALFEVLLPQTHKPEFFNFLKQSLKLVTANELAPYFIDFIGSSLQYLSPKQRLKILQKIVKKTGMHAAPLIINALHEITKGANYLPNLKDYFKLLKNILSTTSESDESLTILINALIYFKNWHMFSLDEKKEIINSLKIQRKHAYYKSTKELIRNLIDLIERES